MGDYRTHTKGKGKGKKYPINTERNVKEMYGRNPFIDENKKQEKQKLRSNEEQEFHDIAVDLADGRRNPFTKRYKDMYGKEHTKHYEGDIFYSSIYQRVKKYSTRAKRDRAYDYIHNYLKKEGFDIHS